MNACPACSADEPDGALCRRCAGRLRHDLDELPELMRELDVVLTRQSQAGSGNGKSKSSETPMPFDWSASHVRDDVVNTITTWVRELDLGDFSIRVPGCSCRPPLARCQGYTMEPVPPNMRAWCRWLTERIERIRFHVAVDEMFDELTYAVADVRRTVDRPAERTFYGKCEICERDLYGPRDASEITCRYCGLEGVTATYRVDGRRTGLWSEAEQRLVSRRVALAALPVYGLQVKPATFRSWIHRERLKPVQDAAGTPLYRLGDVLALARAAPVDASA